MGLSSDASLDGNDPEQLGTAVTYGCRREGGQPSTWMGQGRSLVTAAVAKDGEGDTMDVPVVSKSGKRTS